MDLLNIISNADDTSTILELKDQFEQYGLTVQQAVSGKIFVCCVVDGKPCHDTLYEDHIPVGMPNKPLSERTLTSIIEFVLTNKSSPQRLQNDDGRGNYGLYGASIRDNKISTELITAIDQFLFGG